MLSRSSLVLVVVGLVACGGSIAPVPETREQDPGAPSQPVAEGARAPATSCKPAGAIPLRIADLTGKSAREIVPYGDALWFGVYDRASPSVADVFRVPGGGGTRVTQPIPGLRSDAFAMHGNEIAFARLTTVGDSSTETVSSLVLRDIGTGVERVVVAPSPIRIRIGDIRATSAGLLWTTYRYSDGMGSIARLDGSSASTITELRSPGKVVTDGEEVFYVRSDDSSTRTLEAARVRNGDRRRIVALPQNIREGYRVFGVDKDEVYVSRSVPIGHGTFETGDVRAIRKDGSGERVIVSIPDFDGDVLLDPHYLTWTEARGGTTIHRFPLVGGVIEKIVAAGGVSDLAVDECNLYWSVYEPAGIYARSRRP